MPDGSNPSDRMVRTSQREAEDGIKALKKGDLYLAIAHFANAIKEANLARTWQEDGE